MNNAKTKGKTMGNSIIQLDNGKIKLKLSKSAAGFSIESLSGITGKNFLISPVILWSITLINRTNKLKSFYSVESPELTRITQGLKLVWQVELLGEVTVNIESNTDLQLEWRISIDNLHPDWSVYQINFPNFNWHVQASDNYTLIVPEDQGVAYPNPLQTVPSGGVWESKKIRHRYYPNGNSTMQFLALQHQEELFYFAAHDPEPALKLFLFECDKAQELIAVKPEVKTEINFGDGYKSFPWIMDCTNGDWFDVATIYRKFALTATWTQGGTLEAGKTPRWYQNTPMVLLRLCRGPGYDVKDFKQVAEFMQVPLVLHYYMWHKNAFDADNPYMFPTVPSFREEIRELQAAGIKVMPYLNSYSADITLPEWDELQYSAIRKNEKQEMHLALWSQNHTLAAMCPSAPLWNRLMNMQSMRLVETGVAGIYFDEVPASPPYNCYANNHHHKAGNEYALVKGHQDFFKNIQTEAKEIGMPIVMTSEGCAEPYMLYMDAFLIGNNNNRYQVPLFMAIYHDYMMGFGKYTFTQELINPKFNGAIISKHAQQFSFGCQFGWSRIPMIAIIQQDPTTANFMKTLAHVWVKNADYLARGKMLRPLNLSTQLKPVTRYWAMNWKDEDGTEIKLPPIMNSIWRIDDGSIAIVLVNITEKKQSVTTQMGSIQKLFAGSVTSSNSTHIYPLPQMCVGMVREHQQEKVREYICEGDSENGFKITVPAYACSIILIGSEKKYGIHN